MHNSKFDGRIVPEEYNTQRVLAFFTSSLQVTIGGEEDLEMSLRALLLVKCRYASWKR